MKREKGTHRWMWKEEGRGQWGPWRVRGSHQSISSGREGTGRLRAPQHTWPAQTNARTTYFLESNTLNELKRHPALGRGLQE